MPKCVSIHRRSRSRGVGIAVHELAEPTQFGTNARRELMRWFPSSPWVRVLEQRGDVRELIVEERRRFLLGTCAALAGPVLGSQVLACQALASALPLVFQLLEAAAKVFAAGDSSGGTAFFGNDSQSRERAQLITRLVQGVTTDAYDDPSNYRDDADFLVDVPAKVDDFAYLFDGLVSGELGDHFLAGTSTGETLFSQIFRYV
jgi:hypothetical protein